MEYQQKLFSQILHIPASVENNLNSVSMHGTFCNKQRFMGFIKAVSLFIKIPSHFKLSLSGNHGNQVISPHIPADILVRDVLLQCLKKMTLVAFISLCPPSTLFTLNSFTLYLTLITDSLITLTFFSPLSALYLLLISAPIPHTYTPLSLFSVHPAPVREERQPEQLPAQRVQPSQHPHRFSQPPTLCHAQ